MFRNVWNFFKFVWKYFQVLEMIPNRFRTFSEPWKILLNALQHQNLILSSPSLLKQLKIHFLHYFVILLAIIIGKTANTIFIRL